MMVSHIDKFPEGFTPFKEQVDAINKIFEAFKKHKFVICCAPTGSGKSFISKTLANISNYPEDWFVKSVRDGSAWSKSSNGYIMEDQCDKMQPFGAAILTITKQLQDQYVTLFKDVDTLKGKSNYICQVDTNFAVDSAPCIFVERLKAECLSCNRCHYYNARSSTLTSRCGVFNYKMFMNMPKHVASREFIVCDEAAELEDEIVKHFSIDVSFRSLKYLLPKFNASVDVDDIAAVRRYIGEISVYATEEVEHLEKAAYNTKTQSIVSSKAIKLIQLKNILGQVNNAIENWDRSEYIAEETKTGIIIAPVYVDNLAKTIFDRGKKVLLMSATIIDPVNYAKSLGITDYEYVEVPTTFDAKNAPIKVLSKYKLNYKNLNIMLPTFKQIIERICDNHKNEKGIIHTHTMQITNFLRDNLLGDRFLFRESGVDNQSLLQCHTETKDDTILVSPSMTHGVDLKDDLARFQIIVKAPYLPLQSKRISKLSKISRQWYINKMLTTVIQAAGRGIRTKDDHCTTYILDGCITETLLENTTRVPKYFLERFV